MDSNANARAIAVATTKTATGAMISPSMKGERSEAAILHALVASGRVVLLPWGASQRYDFVINDGENGFMRVQCKSGFYPPRLRLVSHRER